MPLIYCKIHLELNQIADCISSSAGDSAEFKIKGAKLHAPIVTLFTKDNVNLSKKLSVGFKRSVYWNNYQTIPEKVIIMTLTYTNSSVHHFKRLFAVTYDPADDNEAGIKNNRNYFFPKSKN